MAGIGSPMEKYVLEIMFIAAAGIFAIGIVVGIVAVVSHGIHREEKRFREGHGIWAGPDTPEHFLAEEAPDGVSLAVRRLNGLYVRHLPSSIDHDADLGVRV